MHIRNASAVYFLCCTVIKCCTWKWCNTILYVMYTSNMCMCSFMCDKCGKMVNKCIEIEQNQCVCMLYRMSAVKVLLFEIYTNENKEINMLYTSWPTKRNWTVWNEQCALRTLLFSVCSSFFLHKTIFIFSLSRHRTIGFSHKKKNEKLSQLSWDNRTCTYMMD